MRRIVPTLLVTALLVSATPVHAGTRSAGDVTYVQLKGTAAPGAATLGAFCPDGSRATNVGGSVSGTKMRLLGARLFDSVSDVDADEDDIGRVDVYNASSKNGSVAAVIICLTSADQTQLTYNRSANTYSSAVGAAGGSLACLNGATETVVGGGVGMDANPHDSLAASYPTGDSAWAYGFRGGNPPNPNPRTLNHVAVCLPDATRPIEIREKSVTVRAQRSGSVKVGCPGRSHVIGGGLGVGDANLVQKTMPFDDDDADRAPDDGWSVRAFNSLASSDTTVTAHAICLLPVA